MDPVRFLKNLYQSHVTKNEARKIRKRRKFTDQYAKNNPFYQDILGPAIQFGKQVRDNRMARSYQHRVQFPWLFGTAGYEGVPREFDAAEMRRLSKNEICEMCRNYRSTRVQSTPFMFIKTEDAKQLWKPSSTMSQRPDKLMSRLQSKAQSKPSLTKAEEIATDLFNNENDQGFSFQEMLSMLVQDLDQVGNANLVQVFAEEYWEHVGGSWKLKDNAIPGMFTIYDNLQFNLKIDDYGMRMGYYHYPLSSGLPMPGSGVFFSKPEIMWLTQSPRTYRKYGMGKTEAIQARLDLLTLTTDQETNYFVDGAINPGILFLLGFQNHEVNAFRSYYQNEVQGKPGALAVYGAPGGGAGDKPDAKYLSMNYTYKDLQMMERSEWYTRLAVAEHDLNLTVLGLSPAQGAYSRDINQTIIAFEKAISPLLKNIEQAINRQVIWPHISENLSFVFNPMMSFDELERRAYTARGMYLDGLWTQNESRAFVSYGRDDNNSAADQLLDPARRELPDIRLGFLLEKLEKDGTLYKDEVRSIISDLFPEVDLDKMPDGIGQVPRPQKDPTLGPATTDEPGNPYDQDLVPNDSNSTKQILKSNQPHYGDE